MSLPTLDTQRRQRPRHPSSCAAREPTPEVIYTIGVGTRIPGTSKRASRTRTPLHVRMSVEERCQLARVAARLALSPSATIRFLINREDTTSPAMQSGVVPASPVDTLE
jgi:hypothetical protein